MRAYLLLVAMTALATFRQYGFSTRSIIVWLVTSGLIAIPSYFSSQHYPVAGPTERTLARTWLVSRRVLSFVMAFLFIYAALDTFMREYNPESWLRAFVWLLIACFFIRFGLYGAGEKRSLSDARQVHEQRKRRYWWSW